MKDSFDFKCQSVGVYTNLELIHLDCDKIKEQLQDVHDKCSSQIYEINMRSTAMKNSADLILQGYDYTIGKVIEYFYTKNITRKKKVLQLLFLYVGLLKTILTMTILSLDLHLKKKMILIRKICII